MKKTNIWLIQLTLVAMFGLVMGSPAFAHKKESSDTKWHEKLDKKYEKKMAKHPDKAEKWEKKYNKKLAKHNAKHHAEDVTDIPPASNPEPVCTAWFNGMCVSYQ